jgi:hypothetical protein
MKRLVLFLTLVLALATALLVAASPAAAHCVQTPVGFADLAPGHLAAAGGHNAAIAHSGGAVGTCDRSTEELNETAPDNNPETHP